jgi:imidazolonepropionase
MKVDLLIYNAAQLVTCASAHGPKRGASLNDAGIVENGAVAVADGVIVAAGHTSVVRDHYAGLTEIDAAGKIVCPGFVDCHTHLVFAGDRSAEFELKLRGASYMEILQAGGGILSTMRATRAAALPDLVAATRMRLREMRQFGTTTVEIKTGYGLDTPTELKLLAAIAGAAQHEPATVVPTFLGAHAVPPEFAGRTDAYVRCVVEKMLPAVLDQHGRSFLAAQPFFCDVFCEANVFDYAQTAQILTAAQTAGMPLKLHADEFVSLDGVELALDLGAISVDHLDVTPPRSIARLGNASTLAVLLPAVNYHLGSTHFADARALIEASAAVALATDANPGSAPCYSLPFVMGLACRYQKVTPAEALNAATINAAYAIGMGERVGSIEPGKQADLLILDAPDYRHLAYWIGRNLVATIFQRGLRV